VRTGKEAPQEKRSRQPLGPRHCCQPPVGRARGVPQKRVGCLTAPSSLLPGRPEAKATFLHTLS
jgi:hypothetical protein